VDPNRQRKGEGEEKSGGAWAEPAGTGEFFIYSNKIQISLNCFDQKVDYQAPKIPNKIWLEII
jgi:hypothetical protein